MSPKDSSREQDIDDKVTSDPKQVFLDTPIIEIFNKPSNLRILLTLVDANGSPMSVASICDQAEVDRQTFYNNEGTLRKYGLLETADKIGNAQRYCVDMTSEPIQALSFLYDAMIDVNPNSSQE